MTFTIGLVVGIALGFVFAPFIGVILFAMAVIVAVLCGRKIS